ncbi:MAG: hypothetical protein BJ554DRAFT_3364, partial [Olpidium bornovanus]
MAAAPRREPGSPPRRPAGGRQVVEESTEGQPVQAADLAAGPGNVGPRAGRFLGLLHSFLDWHGFPRPRHCVQQRGAEQGPFRHPPAQRLLAGRLHPGRVRLHHGCGHVCRARGPVARRAGVDPAAGHAGLPARVPVPVLVRGDNVVFLELHSYFTTNADLDAKSRLFKQIQADLATLRNGDAGAQSFVIGATTGHDIARARESRKRRLALRKYIGAETVEELSGEDTGAAVNLDIKTLQEELERLKEDLTVGNTTYPHNVTFM